MDARDKHNGQRDKRTDGRTDEDTRRVSSSVRPSLRWSLTLRRCTCDWRSRVQSQPLHCRVQPWTSCSHTLSSACEVTSLWLYI